MRHTLVLILVAGGLVGLTPLRAQDSQEVSAAQSREFALGFTLRSCDLRFLAFTQSVKQLKEVDDDQTAGAEIAHLSKQTVPLRHTQAVAYEQVEHLLTKMGAPPILQTWAAQTADTLNAPLLYSIEAQTLAKTEPETALTLAELDEVKTLKTSANAQQPLLVTWLKLSGGAVAAWTADVGSYTADLRAATSSGGQNFLPVGAARRLLEKSPPDAPSATRGKLAELIPRYGGNLQNLATIPPPNLSAERLNRVSERLLEIYVPRRKSQ